MNQMPAEALPVVERPKVVLNQQESQLSQLPKKAAVAEMEPVAPLTKQLPLKGEHVPKRLLPP